MKASRPIVLLVEDEEHLGIGLKFNLEQSGYRVLWAKNGEDGLLYASENSYALALIDLMLPEVPGEDIIRSIRNTRPLLPIVAITAKSGRSTKLDCLKMGVDDFLSKPFDLDELLLKTERLILKHGKHATTLGPKAKIGNFQVDLKVGEVFTHDNGPCTAPDFQLTEQELKALKVFLERPRSVLSRQELLKAGWEQSGDVQSRTVDNFVMRLRRYFGTELFVSVRSAGYKYIPQ